LRLRCDSTRLLAFAYDCRFFSNIDQRKLRRPKKLKTADHYPADTQEAQEQAQTCQRSEPESTWKWNNSSAE
jgi:hypothetical protein